MYEAHYGFSRKPFGINPDPAFLYLNANYREAIALLQYGIQEKKGIVSLIGEVGTGKTMLLNLLLDSLGSKAQTIAIPPVKFGYNALVSFVVEKLRAPDAVQPGQSAFDELFSALQRRAAEQKPVVLLVDEAQDFDNETLENIRLLSNFETPTSKLLQVLLVGQPELRAKLDQPALRQLKQRIAVTYILKPLSAEETPSYIAHRLKSAGYSDGTALFAPEALELISGVAQGIPRLVNAVCDNALLTGFAANKHWIDVGMVREAANDLMLEQTDNHRNALREDGPRHDAATAEHALPLPTKATGVGGAPWRIAAVFSLLLLMLVALFATAMPGSAPADWGQRLRAAINAALKNPRADAAIADDHAAGGIDPLPVTAVVQPFVAPETPAQQSAPDEPAYRPELQESTEPAASDNATEAVLIATSSSRAGVDPVSGGARNGAVATEPKATDEPNPSAADTVSTIQKAPDHAPPAPPPMMEQDGRQRDKLTPPSPQAPNASAPGRLDLDQQTTAIPEPEASPTKGPSVDAQSARPSAAAPIGQIGEAGAMLGSYAATAERVATAAAEPDSARAPNPPTVVTIGRGDTITRIASRIYGNVGIYELAAIRIANPDIRNLDVVDHGHQVVFPDLQSGLLLSNDDDGATRVLLGATRSLSTARALQTMLERNGVSAEIVADELSDTITAYRLEGRLSPDGPPTTEALDKLSTLRLKLAAYGE